MTELQTPTAQSMTSFLEGLPEGALRGRHVCRPATLLAEEGPLAVYYAPFPDQKAEGRVALVGLTPGLQQMCRAYEAARSEGSVRNSRELRARLRSTAAFAGPMRENLITMLDDVGVARALGLRSARSLFVPTHAHLAHATSLLKYPVLKNGKNYTGHGPRPRSSALLTSMIDELFVPEMRSLRDCLIVPMGRIVDESITKLGLENPVLHGFPHPSGANGHRKAQFAEARRSMRRTVRSWAREAARHEE